MMILAKRASATATRATPTELRTRIRRPRTGSLVVTNLSCWQPEGRQEQSLSFLSSYQIHTQRLVDVASYPLLWGFERRYQEPHSSFRNNDFINNNHIVISHSNNIYAQRFFSTTTAMINETSKATSAKPKFISSNKAPPNTKKVVIGDTTTATKMATTTASPTSSSLRKNEEPSEVARQQRKQSRRRQRQRQLRIQEIQTNSILHHHSLNTSSSNTHNNKASSFQLQTPTDFGRFFDTMAVDYTLVWMDQMTKRIQEKIDWLLMQHAESTTRDARTNATGASMIPMDSSQDNDDVDDDNTADPLFGTAVTQIVAVLLETTNPNDTLQIKILEQLLRIVTTTTTTTTAATGAATGTTPAHPKHKQQQQQQLLPVAPSRDDYALATLLMTARERAVRLQQPLFWNKQDLHQRQEQHNQQNNDNDAAAPKQQEQQRQQQGDLERRRLERHVMKSQQQLRDEALQLVLLLRTKLPKKYFKDVVSVFESYVGWNHTILGAGAATTAVDTQQTNRVIEKKKKTLQEIYEPHLVVNSSDSENSSIASSTTGIATAEIDPLVVRKKGHLPLRRLGKHLTRTARTHLFHVAEPIASFFYIIDKDGTDNHTNDTKMNDNISKKKNAPQPSLVATDPPVVQSRNRWTKSRRFFIKTMMDVQEKMVACIQGENDKALESMQRKLDQNKLPAPLDNNSNNEEQQKNSKTINKKKSTLVDDKHLQVVAANQMEQELSESKKRLDQTEQGSKKKGPVGQPARLPVAHYVLDAMYLHEHDNTPALRTSRSVDNSASAGISDRPLLLPSQSMVLIDNLPIDITREEVAQLYSRCGDIASVQLYNQRPDLDPGPLTKTQLDLRRKSQSVLAGRRRHRRQHMQHRPHFKSWHRPRTPVYAMLTFEDSTGYNRAADDTLRIFGMMIQRHPARSIRPSELQSLFIEPFVVPYHGKSGDGDGSINGSQLHENDDKEQRRAMIADLVYEVGQLMGPDFLVSLESGHIHHVSQKISMGSCEIKFPSFEVALEARDTLIRELDMLKGNIDNAIDASTLSSCGGGAGGRNSHTIPMWTVNWLRTPRDALEWWTRKRGFDS